MLKLGGECSPSATGTGGISDIGPTVEIDSCYCEQGAAASEYDGNSTANFEGECIPSATSIGGLSDIGSAVVMDSHGSEQGAVAYEFDGNSFPIFGDECSLVLLAQGGF